MKTCRPCHGLFLDFLRSATRSLSISIFSFSSIYACCELINAHSLICWFGLRSAGLRLWSGGGHHQPTSQSSWHLCFCLLLLHIWPLIFFFFPVWPTSSILITHAPSPLPFNSSTVSCSFHGTSCPKYTLLISSLSPNLLFFTVSLGKTIRQ